MKKFLVPLALMAFALALSKLPSKGEGLARLGRTAMEH
jgi:hypothetical protein